MVDGLSAEYVVCYLSEDEQGGYWPVTPLGPYSLSKARQVAERMRQRADCRQVKVKLRVEVEVPFT